MLLMCFVQGNSVSLLLQSTMISMSTKVSTLFVILETLRGTVPDPVSQKSWGVLWIDQQPTLACDFPGWGALAGFLSYSNGKRPQINPSPWACAAVIKKNDVYLTYSNPISTSLKHLLKLHLMARIQHRPCGFHPLSMLSFSVTSTHILENRLYNQWSMYM